MNKYLTALLIVIGSISGVAHAQCGPNGCSADTEQYYAPKRQAPTYQGYNYSSANSQPSRSSGCSSCSR